jgi:hypothetical protein
VEYFLSVSVAVPEASFFCASFCSMAINPAGEYRSGVGAASCANAPKLAINPMVSKTTEVLFMCGIPVLSLV